MANSTMQTVKWKVPISRRKSHGTTGKQKLIFSTMTDTKNI